MTATSKIFDQMADPMWRLHNLYTIQDKSGRKVPFQPNTAQIKYLQNCTRSDVILKARQLGMTTLMCIVGLDECLFISDWNVAIIAHTINDANQIFDSKVKFPYDNLPDVLRAERSAQNDRAGLLKFSNSSQIRVATSARSGTLQRLHVSEFGKICSIAPSKAREIVTGAFPAVGQNPKTLESTAEGQEGYFYQFCQEAQEGRGQFAFHFYPWHDDPGYVYRPELVRFTRQHDEYFLKLQVDHGITLTEEQKAWWVQQEEVLGADMKRENPSTPAEAFEQAIEGAYFAPQLTHAEINGSIGRFPVDHKFGVNTFWDLGRNDMTAIWLHQRVGGRDRFVGYYENSGEHISHYINWVNDWAKERRIKFDDHFWPHDGARQDLFLTDGRLAEAEKLGLKPSIVQRTNNKMEDIDAARARMANCDWDAHECEQGLKRLRHYRKEWDEQREVWKDRPRHDNNSHGADAFMVFATGFAGTPDAWSKPIKRGLKGVA